MGASRPDVSVSSRTTTHAGEAKYTASTFPYPPHQPSTPLPGKFALTAGSITAPLSRYRGHRSNTSEQNHGLLAMTVFGDLDSKSWHPQQRSSGGGREAHQLAVPRAEQNVSLRYLGSEPSADPTRPTNSLRRRRNDCLVVGQSESRSCMHRSLIHVSEGNFNNPSIRRTQPRHCPFVRVSHSPLPPPPVEALRCNPRSLRYSSCGGA